jgi:hypothetical protein
MFPLFCEAAEGSEEGELGFALAGYDGYVEAGLMESSADLRAVRGIAHGGGRDGDYLFNGALVACIDRCNGIEETLAGRDFPFDGYGGNHACLTEALTEMGNLHAALELLDAVLVHIGDEQARGDCAEVDCG